jgi:hypothetical protein
MGASLAMIDRHYGHLARDGRDHAVALLDAYARDSAAGRQVDVAAEPASPLGESGCSIVSSLTFGAVDVSWTPPFRNASFADNKRSC